METFLAEKRIYTMLPQVTDINAFYPIQSRTSLVRVLLANIGVYFAACSYSFAGIQAINTTPLEPPQVSKQSVTAPTANISSDIPLLTHSDHFKSQRKHYRQTLTAIRKGHKTNSQKGLNALQDYPLHSYLVKEELQRRLKSLPYKEVDQFLKQYNNTVAAKRLRQKWLSVLQKKKLWSQYISYYQDNIRSKSLRCGYLEALHQNGYGDVALSKTSDIWLAGKSLPDACNNVFKRWREAGGKTDELVWKRIKLALDAKNTVLARYLSERASAELKPYARRLISVHRKPRRLAVPEDFQDSAPHTVDIIAHGLKRLAVKDAEMADKLWISYRGYIEFSDEQYRSIRNKIARQIIASGRDDALQWLIVHDPNAEDSYLLEWRIRLALKQQQWSRAGHWISLLPEQMQQQGRWRYWLARVYQQTGQDVEQADKIMNTLADERHYYGFLAADAVGLGYDFNHSAQIISDADYQSVHVPPIARAFEFYKLGELTRARREWAAAISTFDQQQMSSATALAQRWGWHQQAIHTTIKAQQWNDLSIRFPLAYRSHMVDAARSTTISLEWLYAVARQESAFAGDAYSSAGARGLLQILPSTAKTIARKTGLPYKARDLYRPDKNITLGSLYLKQLLEDFQGNRILATAAYNAGPHRVKKWLKRQPAALPYDIWIETLPFYETRSYVQNVLAFSVIYGYRLGINAPLIGAQESIIAQPLQRP